MRPVGFFSWLMFIGSIVLLVAGIVTLAADLLSGKTPDESLGMLIMAPVAFFIYLVPAGIRRSQKKAEEQSTALLESVQNSETLERSCSLTLTRERSFAGAVVPLEVLLNGTAIGKVKNGATISASATRRKNVIQCPPGPAFAFEAQAGGSIRLSFAHGGKMRQV
ncbi:MAG: hypothetical protein LBT68_05085 [Spirochaetales bacterium]|jgi:hypothetical protein|nr:hypothetical protein [Spirochaetales bacterium]